MSSLLSSQKVTWKQIDGELKPYINGEQVVWCAQPGSQSYLLTCPSFECLAAGTRGSGKTDVLLMDFLQHVGQGFGSQWRGVIFRRTYPELTDIIEKSTRWFKQIIPGCDFNKQKTTWHFPEGEELLLRPFERPEDYWDYHGHAYPWIAWEELASWPTDACYKSMMSCCRSTNPRMPRKYRSTTNPYGLGTNWIKRRWHLPLLPGKHIHIIPATKDSQGDPVPERAVVISDLSENKVLTTADPGYKARIRQSAQNKAQEAAWLENRWDVSAGGMVDDLWSPEIHVVPDIEPQRLPHSWVTFRAYDHGQSKPFSVGWWAVSNGEPIRVNGRVIGGVKGDMIRLFEWYGCEVDTDNIGLRLSATEIATGITVHEIQWGISGRFNRIGVADDAIFDDYQPRKSVAGDMAAFGIRWMPAGKGPGSRIQGWQTLRTYLKGALPVVGSGRELPGMFVCERCSAFQRIVPTLPRDQKNLDDVDEKSEDHIGDETRYALRRKAMEATSGSFA